MLILIPKSLTSVSLAKFSHRLVAIEAADEYVFDFGHARWFPPFSMLLLAMILKQFKMRNPRSQMRARNFEQHTYAAHFGFFQLFGLAHGNRPGDAPGNLDYLPIQQLSIGDIRNEAMQSYQEVGDVVERKAGELATMLTRKSEGTLHDTLTYSIREIIRNVAEHSEAEEVSLCAQYWPQTQRVEVGIADAGIGICSGLANNPSFRGLSNKDALQTALMPGVSGNTMAGRGSNPWQNSGYGLYMTNRICRNGGSFLIASGDSLLKLDRNGKTDTPCCLQGTAVRLLIDTRRLGILPEQLSKFADDGRRVAQEIRGANASFASSASQMLTRDFEAV
ncbi:MAG: ATP-binding protein [Yoonia sp.]|nr:ATP-binding protein [Yoonia sp.]